MSRPAPYDVILRVNGHEVRLRSGAEGVTFWHDRIPVSAGKSQAGEAVVFEVEEQGATVTFDLLFLPGPPVRCFLGRNGDLIFSDAPGLEINLTDGPAERGTGL